jgi:hypothetical protein
MTDFDAETMLGEPTREPQLMKNISTSSPSTTRKVPQES